MTPDIAIVIGLLAVGFILFLTEIFSIDITAMILLSILFLFGYLTPEQAISGFSNPAVLTIAFLFILSHALQKTGILEYLVIRINKIADRSRFMGRAVYLFTIGLASAVVNNTAIVAIFMPVTIRLSHKYKMSPSKMLIPLSYAAILGGTLTLVGTSTNLLVNSIYSLDPAVEPMGMFEFTKYGIILMSIGLLYILFVAPKLLPSRTVTSSLTKSYHLGGYLTEMRVTDESPLVGDTCFGRGINKNYDVMVLDILRGKKMITTNIRQTTLEVGDVLFVRGTLENFLVMKEIEKVTLLTDEKLTQQELEKDDNLLVECLLTEKSDLVGHSLMSSNFRRRYGAFILAIRREGTIFRKKIAHVVLQAFDTFLVYGPSNKVSELSKGGDFIVLGEVKAELRKQKFWWMSIVVIIGVVGLAATGTMPILKTAMFGVVVLLALGVLTPQEGYQSIHWQVIVLIAALIPVGIVIESSGAAEWLGGFISSIARMAPREWQAHALLALIYLITMILTEMSSNAATAIIMTPIALAVTQQMGFEPRAFIFAVAFAASASFITPVGYQTNLMVYGPGGYKFSDYIRVGFPLALIFWGTAVYFLPIFWPI
ncbi:MAG: TRAP transporter large permease subunit [Candidatus Marinimicrobia bacterium]|jgi:di/tricarboxylate transporter|nr:TRAP transporter large permease subunit [Candidatus Neomarinimicrobiota bacterium]MBT3502547.1 TRAP transporter large permease subunit [Candidatus Neomarinimicrobiota bacterium]MBT3839584.1 TRAP transporter large permease subunit [Candidatus Neomarinimicrobiota bacterium]MBT3999111.1 TRAP transporter large permease subunit [Candidatus Neomarinimicrobiota bacterium]MBT4282314.1 TRAP transporter large permease subunit [Candidatus Neomarinimicrobiota bacterium]